MVEKKTVGYANRSKLLTQQYVNVVKNTSRAIIIKNVVISCVWSDKRSLYKKMNEYTKYFTDNPNRNEAINGRNATSADENIDMKPIINK